jgi:hypothetical protein
MKKLSKKQEACKKAFLKYPTKSDNEIAKIIGVSQPQVSKYRKEYSLAIDTEFIAITAGKFIHEFSEAAEHWKILIDELEELKGGKKTIIKLNADSGGYFKSEVDLEPLDKLQIIREQANLRARILFLASQGEVREVIKVMRSGQLPSITQ